MAQEKQFTPKQVALSVLEKVGEMMKKSKALKTKPEVDLHKAELEQDFNNLSSLLKGEKHEHIGWDKLHGKLEGEGYSKESADKIAGAIKAKVQKSEGMAKGETENSKKENAKPSEHGAKEQDQPAEGPAPKGEIHPKEHVEGKSDDVREQKDPQHNPKEQAEGNNELAGTTPTQVGQDGKNIPGGDEIKGHLKLAKFLGMKEYKRTRKLDGAQTEAQSSAQHAASIKV